jgi:hypothetical protein
MHRNVGAPRVYSRKTLIDMLGKAEVAAVAVVEEQEQEQEQVQVLGQAEAVVGYILEVGYTQEEVVLVEDCISSDLQHTSLGLHQPKNNVVGSNILEERTSTLYNTKLRKKMTIDNVCYMYIESRYKSDTIQQLDQVMSYVDEDWYIGF